MVRKNKLKRSRALVATVSLAAFIGIGACDSDDDDDTTAAVDTTAVTTGTTDEKEQALAESNPLTEGYPSSLAISVFPVEDSTSLRLVKNGSASLKLSDEADSQDAKEKVNAANRRLVAAEECMNEDDLADRTGFPEPTCYNFDSGLGPFKRGNQEYGTEDGTDGNGEACLVAFARSKVQRLIEQMDRGRYMIEAMMCQAKKSLEASGGTLELPAEGDTLDLTEILQTAAEEGGGIEVSEALISRKADADGNPVYHNVVKFVDPKGRNVEVNLVHSPDEDEGTYIGTLWTISDGDDPKAPPKDQAPGAKRAEGEAAGGEVATGRKRPPAQPATALALTKTEKKRYVQITYAKTTDDDGDPLITAEMRYAKVEKSLDPITDAGLLDFNTSGVFTGTAGTNDYGAFPTAQANDTIEGMQYLTFATNPDTLEGDIAYWVNPGGNYYEPARGFVFNISPEEDGTLSGCASTGAASGHGAGTGVSIRRAIYESLTMSPVGFYHPFHDQNTATKKDTRQSGQTGSKIIEQCFTQDPDTSLYEIDSGKTESSEGYDVVEYGNSEVKVPKPKDAKPPAGDNKAPPPKESTTDVEVEAT